MTTMPVLVIYANTALFIYVLIHLFNYSRPLTLLLICLWAILTISIATPIGWLLWRQRIFLWREWLKNQNVDLVKTEKLAVNTMLV